MTNVNMSSDFAVFTSPTFNVSGATKVPCGSVSCYFDELSFDDIFLSAIGDCFASQSMSTDCLTSTTWTTKIYKDNEISYSADIYTTTAISGYTVPFTWFTDSIKLGLESIGIEYEYNSNLSAFTIYKTAGLKKIEFDIGIKFDLQPSSISCPAGYSAITLTQCRQILTSASTYNGAGTPIVTGDTNGPNFGVYGTSFYGKFSSGVSLPVKYTGGVLKDAAGTTLTPIVTNTTNPFWASLGLDTNGRLNNCGLLGLDYGVYAGFSKCIDLPYSGTYYVAIAADNYCEFYVNKDLVAAFTAVTLENFRYWTVFEFDLPAGKNIIKMLGANAGSHGAGNTSSFGAEIYNPTGATPFATLTAATSTASTQANAIFSTKEYIGLSWDVGTTVGWSCSDPRYSPDFCAPGDPVCTFIDVVDGDSLVCTGTCSGDSYTVCNDTFPSIYNNSEGVHIIDPATTTTIPLTFNFTGNTDVFTATSASFKYKIYKYNNNSGVFAVPPIYQSAVIPYSSFSGTNTLEQNIPVTALTLDNQYVVKGFYEFTALTDYLGRLGKKIDTTLYTQYGEYQLYNPHLDYYFLGMTKAESPIFGNMALTSVTYNSAVALQQQVIYVDDYLEQLTRTTTTPSWQTPPLVATGSSYYRTGSIFVLQNTYAGDVFITLNGLTLAKNIDYTLEGRTLTMIGPITNGDIITIFYTRDGGTSTLISESVQIDSSIPSGPTNGQGSSKYYYNTTTGKYEVYTNNQPIAFSNIILNLNGITLLKDIDYYQSTTNKNRIILNGTIMEGDIVTIIYYPKATIINGITEANTYIRWYIETPPQDVNGQFIVQYSNDPTFTTYSVNSIVPYIVGNTGYDTILTLTGTVGTNVYYRVQNEKNYVSICGDKIGSTAYSETVKTIIQSNAINSY